MKFLDWIGNIEIPEKSDFDKWEKELIAEFKETGVTLKEFIFIFIYVFLMFAIPIFILWIWDYISKHYRIV